MAHCSWAGHVWGGWPARLHSHRRRQLEPRTAVGEATDTGVNCKLMPGHYIAPLVPQWVTTPAMETAS